MPEEKPKVTIAGGADDPKWDEKVTVTLSRGDADVLRDFVAERADDTEPLTDRWLVALSKALR